MRRLLYTQQAQDDIADIADYLAEVTGDDQVATQAADRLVAQCEKLAGLPGLLGRSREELGSGLRTFPIGSYLIFFRYREGDLEVARVLNATRDIVALFKDAGD